MSAVLRTSLLALWMGITCTALGACQQKLERHSADLDQLRAQRLPTDGPRFEPLGPEEVDAVFGADARSRRPIYRIGYDDVLHIWGDTEFLRGFGETTKGDIVGTRVKPDGCVHLPLLGAVPATDRTVIEVQDDLRERLKKYKEQPFVSVDLLEARSQKFFVLGEVERAGVYPVDGRVKLLEGISRAGGVTKEADLDNAYVVRDSKLLPISLADLLVRGDTTRSIRMQDGDLVYVPSLKQAEVYVLGEVTTAGPVPMKDGRLSLVAAMAAAGGLKAESADTNIIRIFRGHGCATRAYTLAACEAYEMGNDLDLHPGDRIVVASLELATFERSLRLLQPFITATTTSAITVLGVENALR